MNLFIKIVSIQIFFCLIVDIIYCVLTFISVLHDKKQMLNNDPHAELSQVRGSGGLVWGQIVNPISTSGSDHAHHSTMSPPGFSDLATALLCNCCDVDSCLLCTEINNLICSYFYWQLILHIYLFRVNQKLSWHDLSFLNTNLKLHFTFFIKNTMASWKEIIR